MKKLFQLILLLCAIGTAKAQTFTPPSFADVDNNYRTYVNNVFGALESNRIPTGLLADYGFDFTDPKIYNGSVLVDSTLMEQGIYSELYKTIFTSKFNSNAGIKEVIIKNKMSVAVYHQKMIISSKKYSFNLLNQPTDIYFIEVFDGKEWYAEKLILRKN